MSERPNERAARHIVASVLGVRVRRFEDGTADRQVDAVIALPDGDAGLEVVADHEDAFNAQWDALEKVGHKVAVPSLGNAWSAQLSRSAKVKRAVQQLPEIVLTLDAALRDPEVDTQSALDDMERLGVRMLYPLKGGASGYVNLHAEGWGGAASAQTMAEFVERLLAAAPDVPLKLAAHPTAEKHAFIWTTIGTDYGIQFQLETRDQPLPTTAPDLPSGVTHVWVAGSFTSQGVLAWFPDRGWWRPDWVWPTSGSLILDDD